MGIARRCLRFTAAMLLGAFVCAGVACTSPTLPLPPPSQPTIAPESTAGLYHLSSYKGAQPNAIIVIVNRNEQVPRNKRVSGAQADGEGSWDADVFANAGDALDITQEFGNTRSTPVNVVIPGGK